MAVGKKHKALAFHASRSLSFLILIGLAACPMTETAAQGGRSQTAGRWGTPVAVGFHYPGVSARVSLGRLALEGIYMRLEEANAAGPRLYYLFNPGSRVVFNVGGEYAWVQGKTKTLEYDGRAATGFLGMELFATRRTSVGLDMGLCRVSLEDRTGADADETSLVANISVHLYL